MDIKDRLQQEIETDRKELAIALAQLAAECEYQGERIDEGKVPEPLSVYRIDKIQKLMTLISVKQNLLEEETKQSADPMQDHYYLVADGKKHVTSKSLELVKREFEDFVNSGEYSSIKILNFNGEVVEEWVIAVEQHKTEQHPESHLKYRIHTVLQGSENDVIRFSYNTIEEAKEKFVDLTTDGSGTFSEVFIAVVNNAGEQKTIKRWTQKDAAIAMPPKSENAQFTYELCSEINSLHLWEGKANASLVKKILINYYCDYPNKEGNPPTAQQKFMRGVHLEAKGKQFWKNAKGLYEAHKKATANPVAKKVV